MFDNSQFFSGARGFYPLTIDQSLRFNDDDSAYLSRTPATAGNRKTWTWSGWVKRGNLGSNATLFSVRTSAASRTTFRFSGDAIDLIDGDINFRLITGQVFRDVSSWYHIVLAIDTTEATDSNRVKLYVNGAQVTSFSTATYPSLNFDTQINTTIAHYLGSEIAPPNDLFDGYLAEVHFTDGTAYDADAFGELKSGVWVAKTPSVDYGTNGFYLDFANSADIGNDVSGEGNDWTPNNFTASDVVLDSPTDNFCTLNPLIGTTLTFSDGNLNVVSTGSNNSTTTGTIGFPSSGKYYYEATIGGVDSGFPVIGIASITTNTTGYLHPKQAAIRPVGANSSRPEWVIDGVDREYDQISTTALTANDIIQVIYDADSGKVWFGINNTYYGVNAGTSTTVSASDIANGTNPAYVIDADYTYTPSVNAYSSTETVKANFGQLGFTYTPPTGYLALSTANLPEPTISPADDASPEDYFNTVIWTGDGTSSRGITGVNFQPDFVWFKNRSAAYWHGLQNAVIGSNKLLYSNATSAEQTDEGSGYLSSFDTDGFTVQSGASSNQNINNSGSAYVAWNWKANGSGVSNTDGSITSTVSANTTSGFSIVSYTGNGSTSGETYGHGLDQAPEMIITKPRETNSLNNWPTWHKSLNANSLVYLNLTSAQASETGWMPTLPSDTLVYLGTGSTSRELTNNSGVDYIAYCFHSVEGYSKAFSYTGNGSADGPMVYLGFRPAFIMWKRTDSSTGGEWVIQDTTRREFNPVNVSLYPNLSNAEATGETFRVQDTLSNGFKIRASAAQCNASGGTYIGIAFAENPFKYSLAR